MAACDRESLAPCPGLPGGSWATWDARTCRAGSNSSKGSTATGTDVLLRPESLGCTAGKFLGGSLDL